MKFLCLDIPQPSASFEKYQPHLLNEARHGWRLYKSGVVRDIYFRQDRPGVAIIAECESADAAIKALREFRWQKPDSSIGRSFHSGRFSTGKCSSHQVTRDIAKPPHRRRSRDCAASPLSLRENCHGQARFIQEQGNRDIGSSAFTR